MSLEVSTAPVASETNAPPAKHASEVLHDWIDAVLRDSRRDPQAYLDETVVPHGGE